MNDVLVNLVRAVNDEFYLLSEDARRMVELVREYGCVDPVANQLLFCGDDDFVSHVTAESAGTLAVALEKALDDIPDHDVVTPKLRRWPLPGVEGVELCWPSEDPDNPLTPVERFSGPAKKLVRELASFCRQGGFRIYCESLL